MEPIINPMLIYMINVASTLKFTGGVIALVVFCFYGFYFFTTSDDYRSEEEETARNKTFKVVFKIVVISLILALALPSVSTSYKMLAISYVTTDNVDAAGQGAKEVVDYIFEKVDEMNSGNK